MADLPALPYRAGTYSTFLSRMLSGLDRQETLDGPNQGVAPLRGVNIESTDDFIMALLRGWAAVGDVLTFYQERIANECYLGSATEPRSVLELAHGIGYRPNPGVAASTYLAFTVAETPGSPERVTIPEGTPVQSIPTQSDQLPQTFETSHEIEARASWNQLRPYIPQRMLRQSISSRTNRLRLRGLATALNPGDPILLIGDKVERDEEGIPWYLRTLRTIEPNSERGYTLVTWDSGALQGRADEPLVDPRVFALRRRLTLFGHDAPNWNSVPENIKLRYSSRRGGLQLSLDQGGTWQPLDTTPLEQPVRALVINTEGIAFAGLASAGVFRSDDRGATWDLASTGLTNLDVNALHVDQRGYLYAGTANGVFRSTDNGNQWEGLRGEFRVRRVPLLSPLDTELPATATRALITLLEPDDQRTYLFAGTDRGMFRWASDSSGWQAVNHGLPNRDDDSGEASVVVFSLALDPQTEHLFAGTDYGVFRSTNRGGRWRPANTGLPGFDSDSRLTSTRVRALVTLVDPADSQTCLFAGTDGGVFRSTDGGDHLEAVNSGLPGGSSEKVGVTVRVSSLAVCPSPENQRTFLIAGTDQGIFRSEDLGASWSEIPTDLVDKSVHALAAGPQGELAIATPVTGVTESNWPEFHIAGNQLDLDFSQPGITPGSWIVLREQRLGAPSLMRLLQATNVVIVPREDFGLSGMVARITVEPNYDLSTFDLRRTEVLALSQSLELFTEVAPHVEPLSGDVLRLAGLVQDLKPGQAVSITGSSMKVRVGDLGGVFRLEGASWESMYLPNQDIRTLVINRDREIFAGTREGGVFLYSSVNHWWSPRNTQLTALDVRALVLNSRGWVFAGTNGGGVFRSSDNGDYWTPVNNRLTGLEVRALAVGTSDRLFAGTRDGVFRSTDDGNSWVAASAGLATLDVCALAIDGSGDLYAGTRGGGVFRSEDNGDSWMSVDVGLTNRDVRALAVDAEGNVLAGTAGGGVFFLRPGSARWTPMNDLLSFKDVRALAAGLRGEILAGTRGGGVFRCPGVLKRWEHLATGLSNDVRALAATGRDLAVDPAYRHNVIVAGARNMSILTSADGLESRHLQQTRLFGVSPQAVTDLDQGAIPGPIITRFEDLTVPLSKDAVVIVREEGVSWLIEDPAGDVYPVRSERGSINVYRLPAPLTLVSAPMALEGAGQMMRYQLVYRLGFTGLVTAKTGELALVPGFAGEAKVSEVSHIQGAEVVMDEGYTTLTVSSELRHVYDPRTVTVSANVAHATHGKTVEQDVLGSGRGDEPYQSFTLNHLPLTYVSDDTPTGSRSTLQVRVVSEPQQGILPGVPLIRTSLEEGVPWEEVSSLNDSNEDDLHYLTRLDEEGRTRTVFGDGNRGARLPTGTENVVATYRYGIGSEGAVAANSLTLLQRQPLGVTGVTNPVPADGEADPEPMDVARDKAPVAVRPLGRIVSLKDYEDFIYGLAGVGKVQVKSLWNGQTRLAHVTIAGVAGAPIERGSTLYSSIVQAVQANRASPHHQVEIDPADILHFNVAATVYINSSFQRGSVAVLVEDLLARSFSFDNRAFGQGAAASEVTSLIQKVPGVQHVDLQAFYTLGFSVSLQPYLNAYTATWGWVNNAALPAQLMLINAKDGINLAFETAI